MRDHEILRRFLLGELREKKAERVEKRLLEDDELFDLCEAIEAELLDAIVRGELAPAEKERVLQRLAASPQGRARLALAEELVAEADRQRSTQPMPAPLPFRPRPAFATRTVVRWAVAAGLVVTLGGGATWWIQSRPEGEGQVATQKQGGGTGQEIKIKKKSLPAIANQDKGTPPETKPVPPPPPRIAEQNKSTPPLGGEAPTPKTVLVQLASLLRDGDGERLPEVEIPAGTARVHFQMDAKVYEFESYRAELTRDGEEVWSEPHLNPEQMDGGPVLVLDVPVAKLRAGIYKVEILGHPAEGTPQFVMEPMFKVTHGK